MENEDVIIQTVVMLKASKYSMADSNDPKRKIEGVTCFYYPFKGFNNPVGYKENDEGEPIYGADAVKVSFHIDFWKLVQKHGTPAVYKFTKETGVDSQTRKEKTIVTDVKFMGYLNPTIAPEPFKPNTPPKP